MKANSCSSSTDSRIFTDAFGLQVEMSVNDQEMGIRGRLRRSYERMLRKLLNFPHHPSVILLQTNRNFDNPSTWVFHFSWRACVVSYKDPYSYKEKMSELGEMCGIWPLASHAIGAKSPLPQRKHHSSYRCLETMTIIYLLVIYSQASISLHAPHWVTIASWHSW